MLVRCREFREVRVLAATPVADAPPEASASGLFDHDAAPPTLGNAAGRVDVSNAEYRVSSVSPSSA